MSGIQQADIGGAYLEASEEELAERIRLRRKEFGDDLLILCHHYQQEAVFQFADRTGDSLKLARNAADSTARNIVFCGVHFMAESADILTSDAQNVFLPDLRAGCPMADMASAEEVEGAWGELAEATDNSHVVPVTYVNSSAKIGLPLSVTGAARSAPLPTPSGF